MLTIEQFSEIVNRVLNRLIEKYGFIRSDYKYVNDNSSAVTYAVEKNDLICYIWINNREGYNLYFRHKNWQEGHKKVYGDFLNTYFNDEDEIVEYFNKNKEIFNNLEIDSYKWNEVSLNFEITFIETHFPTVFTEGDLSMFDEK